MSGGQVTIQRSTFQVQVAVAALCLCFAIAADAAVTINNVTVTVLPRPTAFGSSETYHGYMEYRVALSNLSPDADKRVRLTLPANSWGRGDDQIRSISRTVVLAPGASTVVSLLQPPVMIRGDGLGVWVNGESNRVSLSMIDHAEPNYHGSGIGSALLVSQGTDARARSILKDRLDATRSAASVNQSEVPIDQWSSNWLSYTRYDGVMVTDQEMKDASILVVEALKRFTMAGGTLIVTGSTWQPPDDWRPQATSTAGISESYSGFGVIVVVPDQPGFERFVGTIADHVNTSTQPWRSNRSIEEANNIFPVVDDLQVPKRGLLVLMIGFAVAIGPVNLWLLAKYKRRMWLLWTVPTISLVTCLAVWVYATAAEGWSGHEKTATLTILDQPNQTATTIGWAAFYAPITPGGGLRYDLATELTPQIGRFSGGYYYRGRSGGRSRSIDLGDTQHLVSGWIIARVPSHFQVRKPAKTVRERLNFRTNSNGIEVVNGLGAKVVEVVYADGVGQVYTAGPIAAGETATMNKSTDRASAGPGGWRTLYAGEWVGPGGSIGQATRSATKLLRPGTYVAVLDGEPFLESGLDKPTSRESESVVIGYVGTSSGGNGGTR